MKTKNEMIEDIFKITEDLNFCSQLEPLGVFKVKDIWESVVHLQDGFYY